MNTRSNTTTLPRASQAVVDTHGLETRIANLASRSRLTPIQQNRLRALQEQLNVLRSPAYKLSDDVLMYIFELSAAGIRDQSFAISVSHVASRWRRVALATPRLWLNIRMKLPFHPSKRNKYQVETVLERVREMPLRLVVSCSAAEDPYKADAALTPLQCMPISAIETSKLVKTPADLVSGLLLRCEMACLVGLNLSNINLRFTDRLRHLNLLFPFIDPTSGYPFQFLLDALEPCINLEYLSLCRICRDEGEQWLYRQVEEEDRFPQRWISLPTLRTLSIEDYTIHQHPLYTIIQGIEANLQRVAIVGEHGLPAPCLFQRVTATHLIIGLDHWPLWFLSPTNMKFLHNLKTVQLYRVCLHYPYLIVELPSSLPYPSVLILDELIYDTCWKNRTWSDSQYVDVTDVRPRLRVEGLGIDAVCCRVIAQGTGYDVDRRRDRLGMGL